jgi:LAO/AO transport system kinase
MIYANSIQDATPIVQFIFKFDFFIAKIVLLMKSSHPLLSGIEAGSFIELARALTLVENELATSRELLKLLTIRSDVPVVGITGPPGAGKSTLVHSVTKYLVAHGKRVAILAIDPTSPFNFGSLLGDRIRMASLYNHPDVYIRSVANRGALGGISAKTIEMVDVLKASNFDIILIETVGVGQSEIDVAGLADITVVVFVPESGDEIQNIKSGLMEIAQAFVVNKADREGADAFANNVQSLMREQHQNIPVFKTIADKGIGIDELCNWLLKPVIADNYHRSFFISEQAYKIIQRLRMKDVDKIRLQNDIRSALSRKDFNLYRFVDQWIP